MGLVVEKLEGATVKRGSPDGYCPLIRCDVCGHLVENPSQGRAVWRPGENASCVGVVLLHDGCLESYRRTQELEVEAGELGEFLNALLQFAPAAAGG